jgi:NAD(P)-dependent dehydrogenase (short-subunit alcohol dehydrogenase family)
MTSRIKDKVAIVTGGSSGFGRATARLFADEGAKVIVADLDGAGGQEVVAEIAERGGQASLFVGDVSDGRTAEAIVGHAVTEFGGLDILVNNAGIAQGWVGESWNDPDEVWEKLLRVNLRSAFVCTRASVPAMREGGGGAIVNVSSIGASVCVSGSAYAASKAGMIGYTRTSAVELAPSVRMNCVSPGFMLTPMSTGARAGFTEDQRQEVEAHFGKLAPMGRAGTSADIANAVLFLASDDASFITGTELVVDGGHLVRAYGAGDYPDGMVLMQFSARG